MYNDFLLAILFVFIYLFFCFSLFIYFAVNVTSLVTVHCQISSLSLEVIKSIKH